MAVSPLAQIDWTDLDSADMPLAVSLLMSATQERYSIACIDIDGGMRSGQSITRLDKFPYKDNDPDYTTNSGDPMWNITTTVTNLIGNMIKFYADIEKWDDAATDLSSETTKYNLSMTADDSGTYSNRLFEVTGYTSYPDLSVYAPEEVKKWYDMITVCKHVLRNHGVVDDNYYRIFKGVFDVEGTDAGTATIDGAEIYAVEVDVSSTTEYTDYKADQDALFGTKPTTFDESVDTGTYPPSDNADEVFRTSITRHASPSETEYTCWTRAWQITYVIDFADMRTTVGFAGRPLSYKNQTRLETLGENFPTGEDTNFQFPASVTGIDQRYYTTNTVTQVSDKDEIEVDHLLSAVTLPTNITDLSANEVVEVNAYLRAGLTEYFLEFWDAEDGFDYYTP